ncbi:MAG: nitroreductase family protein [Spirochaetales bacterium]|jgi:nitroreductase|nr:nitroreductase family protein [Spirochaetales bacterium]
MNDVIQAIQTRRSCRSFMPEAVKEEQLVEIVDAGLRAPSGFNSQSCHFTILQNKEIVEKISRAVQKTFAQSAIPTLAQIAQEENFDVFYGAPSIVVVSANNKAITPQDDMAVASQNMMLAAESIGVASCWVSFGGALSEPENVERFADLLGLPENHIAHHAIVFGYREGDVLETKKVKEGRVNTVK